MSVRLVSRAQKMMWYRFRRCAKPHPDGVRGSNGQAD
jgi:hypothetical protein